MSKAYQVGWSDIAPHVKRSVQGQEDYFAQAIKAGECQAWQFYQPDIWMITRTEGSELVVCCIEGHGLMDVTPTIIRTALNSRFESIRFHTRRPGLGRMLSRFGFVERERIYSLEF